MRIGCNAPLSDVQGAENLQSKQTSSSSPIFNFTGSPWIPTAAGQQRNLAGHALRSHSRSSPPPLPWHRERKTIIAV